jgi:tetratricopeptide (TPR) repeat protein
VQALKDALQITPQRNELKLWLAKSLISAGSLQEAHQTIENFISSADTNYALLKQAAYMCIHLNDLELAAAALEKALQFVTVINAPLLMDLAIIYSLMNHHKKALDILDIEQDQMDQNPQTALIKADLLCTIGQYEQAFKTLKSIADVVEQSLGDDQVKPDQKSTSPLLYAHDLTLKGYYLRLGQLSRALGNFKEALQYISYAQISNPEEIKLKNANLEAAMIGLDLEPVLEIARETNSSTAHHNNVSQDLLDLICSQVEILLYQDDIDKATTKLSQLAQNGGDYPRAMAIQSRLAAHSGKDEIAREYLTEAVQSFKDNFSNLQSQSLPGVFRQMVILHSIAEANLALGDHRQAIQAWQKVYQQIDSQPLHNWRYLYALVTAAEAQQIATTLAISSHSPGQDCLSEENFRIAEELLEKLNGILPQEQLVCLKARMISAFKGKWPLHLNVDACLQGAEEAAAVLIGSEDEKYVVDILESYPNDLIVLQAYGIFAIRNNKSDAIPYIENALTMDTSDPINHAMLAHLKLDQPEQALKSLETALSFWPEESAWHALAADLYGSLGNAEMANQHICIALEEQPENPGFWQTSAMLNININDLIQAKSDLEKSTAFLPDDPKTWTKMAEVNWRMGDASDAIKNIRKASQLDPENKTLVEVEMQFLYDQKNFTDLETRARETVSKDVSNETAQIFLAKALAKQGKFEQALHTLDEAIRRDPNNTLLVLEKMKVKKDQVGIETVLPDLVSLARDYPENSPVLTTLTDWLIQSNRLDEAEQVAQTTLRVLPEQAEVYVMLGRLQRIRGKLDQAISHLSEAITLDPTLVDAYIEMGKTYQDRRDTERAIQMFEKGSQANPVDPRPYYHAGMALKDIKDYSSAEMMFKHAKRYSPDDANIIRQLGVVTALNLVNNLREVK